MIEDTGQNIVEANPLATVSAQFQPLDPRVVSMWRVSNLIGWGLLIVMVLISNIVVVLLDLDVPLLGILASWALLLFISVWFTWVRPPRLYGAWSYRIDDRVLETRSGLLFQVSRLLPLSRLQHVDLHRGPLERIFGLASLVLHTAGTHSASITIPGLDAETATRLRDHLMEIGGDDAV
jgi:membrane protein YdbS with pleckstrin-like domain